MASELAGILKSMLEAKEAPAPVQQHDQGLPMVMAMFQQQMAQQREQMEREREDRKANQTLMLQLAMAALPLVMKREMDPLTMKLLESSTNKDMMTDMIKMQQAAAAANNETVMTSLRSTFESMNQMKDKMTEQMLEKMSTMGSDKEPNPWLEGIKSIVPALTGRGQQGAVQTVNPVEDLRPVTMENDTVTKIAPAASVTTVPAKKDPMTYLIHSLKNLHDGWDQIPKAKRLATRAKLATLCMIELPDATRAILEDDGVAFMALAKPVIGADQALTTWISDPAAMEWLGKYLGNHLAPMISIMDDEELEDDEEEDDDGEADEESDGEAEGTMVYGNGAGMAPTTGDLDDDHFMKEVQKIPAIEEAKPVPPQSVPVAATPEVTAATQPGAKPKGKRSRPAA